MEILRQVKAKLRVEVQRRLQVKRHRTAGKDIVQRERSMNGPLGGTRGSFDGATPLDQPALLAYVDLLAAPDQADDDTPIGNALGKLHKVLRLRLVDAVVVSMSHADHIGVERALRFVEDEH